MGSAPPTHPRLFALESDGWLLEHLAQGRIAASSCGNVLAACGYKRISGADAYTRYVLAMWDSRSGRILLRTERRQATRVPDCAVAAAPLPSMADEFLDGASAAI